MLPKKKDFVEKGFVIGGKSFDVYISAKNAGLDVTNSHKSLTDVYKNPSDSKREIWIEWLKWYYYVSEDLMADYICINSFSTNFFTIKGSITTNKISYYFYISSTKNLLFLV